VYGLDALGFVSVIGFVNTMAPKLGAAHLVSRTNAAIMAQDRMAACFEF
jgi:hypothetical protein